LYLVAHVNFLLNEYDDDDDDEQSSGCVEAWIAVNWADYNNWVAVIEFGVNDRGSNGAGCFDVKKWADTTELTNVKVAEYWKCSYLFEERKVFIKDEAEIVGRVGSAERAVLYLG